MKSQEQFILQESSFEDAVKALRDIKFALDESSILAITDPNGLITYANDKFCKISKYERHELIGQDHHILNSKFHSKAFFRKLWERITSGHVWHGEIRNKAKDGSYYWVDTTIVPFLDKEGKPYQFVSIRNDITRKKLIQERLRLSENQYRKLAYHDTLTGLPNRLHFTELLQDWLKEKHPFACLFFDLDRFKMVNDTFGHLIGDNLLCKVTSRLEQVLTDTEVLGRFGGDEFVMLTRRHSGNSLKKLSDEILNCLQEPFELDGHEVYVSASIGICLYPQDGMDVETLLKHGDLAMYHAKKEGRNKIRFFTDDLRAQMNRDMKIELALQKAIRDEELEIVMQPVLHLHTKQPVGVEALLRWNMEGEPVSPAEFIPIAEESGLIVPLGDWVLEKACQEFLARMTQYDVRLSVNLSIHQLMQKRFVSYVQDVLRRTSFPPERLILEITESVAIQHFEYIGSLLQELRKMGISIALDDFGTGYSSLRYLKQLPIDIVKIDRSFIRDLNYLQPERTIVKAVIEIAHSLNISVVAEGIETQEQVELLKDMNCDFIQGFYYAHPQSLSDTMVYLKKYKHSLPFSVLGKSGS
ncbi:putative bifunctional diguanylate cyclase/phosphodiesterase [Microbacteriaceae bacterium 4G12]